MSGIAGIWNRDGRPVTDDDLAQMTTSMAHRGPDGVDRWVAGAVGLGHCMLRTTPESLHESQPLVDQTGRLCLTLDGRIDNREELRAALGNDRRHLRNDTDAELVLQACRTWGTGSVVRLIGDFSFALWDGGRRELLCARDFLGKRPFYYHFNASSFRFASEPQAVLADSSIPREPNKGMVGEYLTVTMRSTTETLFKHLYRLPPAHFLVVSEGGLRVTRYWEWDPDLEIRCKDDRDYAAHFLDVCSSAVEARLRSPWPMMVELSGGVDSSSLVGVIEHLRRAGRCESQLDAYSIVFPGRASDESRYIRAVARECGVVTHEVEPSPTGAAPYEAQAQLYLDMPDYPMTMMRREHFLAAREKGFRVVFTGNGPDEWLTGSPYAYADAVRRRRLRRLTMELRAGTQALGLRAAVAELWHYGVTPQVPASIRHLARRVMGQTSSPVWLTRSFCDDSDLVERLRTRRWEGADIARRESASNLDDGWRAHATEFSERSMSAMRQEGRDPFDDRRVVELALALPDDQRWRGQVTKYVLREAVAGLIPESVRTRSDKGNYSHVICEELLRQGGPALFRNMAMEDMGWIDGDKVRAMYGELERRYRADDPAFHTNVWSIWLVVSLERWLRAIF